MPTFQFMFTVADITPQKATAIQTKIEDRLSEDEIVVVSRGHGRTTQPYRVIGVDVTTREVFDETFEASDKQAAEDQATTGHPDRVVAAVRQSP